MRCPRLSLLAFGAFAGIASVLGQSSTSAPASNSASASITVSQATSVSTIVTSTNRNGQNVQTTILSSAVVNVTSTLSASPASSASASATPAPIVLDTKIDPAFAVLGALLILTGIPSAFMGHKNRWTSFFIVGFYTLSLVCFVLITKFGILNAVNPPNKTVRGMFVLASVIAGVVGGASAIFFWKGARYFIGAWGGFAFALFIQCLHNGGLIHPVGFRWIFYIACAVIGFTVCTIPKVHYHVVLISTAMVGASATILGADCYTTAGLKEFYMWNLGFTALFPKFVNNGIQFPVSQTMQIELGMIVAVTVMGAAVQFRILGVLQRKLEEIATEHRKRDEEAELAASDRFDALDRERETWEKDHPTLGKHDRNYSGYSSMPLMKDHDGKAPSTPDTEHRDSNFGGGIGEMVTAPGTDDDKRRAARKNQPAGMLPDVDVGFDLGADVPDTFMSSMDPKKSPTEHRSGASEHDELLSEVQMLRRSIDALRTDSGSAPASRHPSLTSRRTLSIDAANALANQPSHLRPPREQTPRSRIQSMELSALGRDSDPSNPGSSISRPASAPLRDDEWDSYVRDRQLFQPPSGTTAPITPSMAANTRIQMPQAVSDALAQRRARESKHLDYDATEDSPLSHLRPAHKRSNSTGPVTILPPKRNSAALAAPAPRRPESRVKTFEELTERHREKMRDMQGPLTEAQKEQAALDVAKQRWERSKASEKRDYERRYAEHDKRKKSGNDEDRAGRRGARDSPQQRRSHSRSLSADKLAALGGTGGSSQRLSTMKVQDWQRYQQEEDERRPRSGNKRDSVPFPDARRSGQHSRSRSRDLL